MSLISLEAMIGVVVGLVGILVEIIVMDDTLIKIVIFLASGLSKNCMTINALFTMYRRHLIFDFRRLTKLI